uniref:DUF5597 domain-containing protein n=1 Tax=Steinernema glaseri TaxID=37863 RepID=A0A1I8A5Y6_9BILA
MTLHAVENLLGKTTWTYTIEDKECLRFGFVQLGEGFLEKGYNVEFLGFRLVPGCPGRRCPEEDQGGPLRGCFIIPNRFTPGVFRKTTTEHLCL